MDILSTPPPIPSIYVHQQTETPKPVRARIDNLGKQVDELVRNKHAASVSLVGLWRVRCGIVSKANGVLAG
jgi:hypothetical protein